MFCESAPCAFCLKSSLKSLFLRNLSNTLPTPPNSPTSQPPPIFPTSPAPPPPPTSSRRRETAETKKVQEIRIPVPWGHIAGKLWGSPDVQPVLGLHGLQDNAGSFDNLVPLLNVEAFLAVDAVGHGRSSHYPIGQCYHHIDHIFNVRRIVQHFKWDKITIVGHSFGSSLAFAYAGFFPDSVDKFISIECIVGHPRQGFTAQDIRIALEDNLRVEKRLNSPPPAYTYEELIDMYVKGTGGSVSRESCAVLFKRGLVKRGDKYSLSRDPRLKLFSLGFWNEEFLATISSQITCEVLSIRSKDGYSMKGETARRFALTRDMMETSAKRFEHQEVEGTHHVHLNTPQNVAGIINEFLEPDLLASFKLY